MNTFLDVLAFLVFLALIAGWFAWAPVIAASVLAALVGASLLGWAWSRVSRRIDQWLR